MNILPRYIVTLIAAMAACSSAALSYGQVTWVCTTAKEPWQKMPAPQVSRDESTAADVLVQLDAPQQEVDGFGGCFNELGWKALSSLSQEARDGVIASLFSDEGCAFNMARTPIGSSDFSLDYYSLDDTPGDLELKHFSIKRDLKCQIPYIKAAMAFRPKLAVWASAWSPPQWMKENGNYSKGRIKKDPAILKAYANYQAKFVEEYRKAGINIYAVHVQNEPRIGNNYPTCLWSGWEMRDYVRDYMGPTFKERNLDAQIWLGTMNDANFNATVDVVLSDTKAAAFITGVAFQWDGQNIIADAHRLYPKYRLMQSENECHDGKNSFADAEHTFSLFRKYMAGGANAYFFWNMVLQPDGKSAWGWAQNAMITVDPESKKVTYNPEFYVMRHIAHYVSPKSRMVYSTGTWGDKIAFIRPDGATVVIMGNTANRPLPVKIGTSADRSQLIQATLPGHSFSTFVIPPAANR